MKFAIVAALAVATVDAKHHWLKHLVHKIEDFHHKHPHPIREMVEHHKEHMEKHLDSEAGPSKKELMKELYAVKKQLVQHQMKLKSEEYFVKREDKLIAATDAELKKLIAAGASKEKIASVTAALEVEKKYEAMAVKDEPVEKALIEKETAEAKKLWEEIKNLPGSEESGDTPTKKELMKKLWAVKKQMWQNEIKVKAEEKLVKLDEQAITKTEAELKKLVAAGASKEKIEAVTATLALEKAKEVELKKDEVAEQALIKKEAAEAKELWAEIKKLPGSGESGDTPTKKELMKKLAAVKKQMEQNEIKVKTEEKWIKLDEQAIAKSEAELKKLVAAGASKEKIEAVKKTLALEQAKEVKFKKDEVAEEALIKKEAVEAKKLWEEIQKLPKEDEQLKMDVIKLEQIVDGILRGALDAENLTDISTCITDMETIFSETETAVKDFEAGGATNILNGLKEIGNVLQNVDTDMKDCSAAKEDWPRLEALAKVFQSPKSFAYHVGKDILVNGKDIFHEIEAAVSDYKAEQWEQFGLEIGEAAAKTILGDEEPQDEGDDEVVVEDDELFLY